MSSALAIIKEVESSLRDSSIEKRTDVLRRVTDLFMLSAEEYSEGQLALFDGVMGQLITYVEQKTVAELSRRVAPLAKVPAATLGKLARDDNIEISGPILAQSPVLSDKDLVEIASTKSQAHLAQIAIRARLTEMVTDALVDFGDNNVASRLAANVGAQFSKLGMAKMVMKADGDEELTLSIAGRNDVPLRFYQQLLSQATVVVQQKLLAKVKPEQRVELEQIIARISSEMTPEHTSAEMKVQARRYMSDLGQDTELLKHKIVKFANEHRLPETMAGLSMLSGASFENVERLFYSQGGLGIVVLCKALGFDWIATDAIILASPVLRKFDQPQLDELHDQYRALTTSSAQRMLHYWEGRQSIVKAMGAQAAAKAKPGNKGYVRV